MSDLLALTDFDGEEFVLRCRGIYLQCLTRSSRASALEEQTAARIEGMRRASFTDLAELGEALLRVQQARPEEFEMWFDAHENMLGFSLSTANRAKSAARLVREHGPQAAFLIAQQKTLSRPDPILADTLRLTKNIADMTHEERGKWIERLLPWVQTYNSLLALESP